MNDAPAAPPPDTEKVLEQNAILETLDELKKALLEGRLKRLGILAIYESAAVVDNPAQVFVYPADLPVLEMLGMPKLMDLELSMRVISATYAEDDDAIEGEQPLAVPPGGKVH